MSRRNEIKHKEQIQLQLQSQFNKLDQTVLSWLKPLADKKDDVRDTESKNIADEFVNQIVVPTGKGISFDSGNGSGSGSDKDVVTINDFLDSTDSRIKSKRKDQNDAGRGMNKISEVKKRKFEISSNSLRSLSNKLRNDKRGSMLKDNVKPQEKFNTRNLIKKDEKEVEESDTEDDEDDMMRRKSSGKKGVPKKSVKNKRPF